MLNQYLNKNFFGLKLFGRKEGMELFYSWSSVTEGMSLELQTIRIHFLEWKWKNNAGVVILLTVNDYKRGKCL